MSSSDEEDEVFEDTLAIFEAICYTANHVVGSQITAGAQICSDISTELYLLTKTVTAANASTLQSLLPRYTKFFGRDLIELAGNSSESLTQTAVEDILRRLVNDDLRLLRKAERLYKYTSQASLECGAIRDVVSQETPVAVTALEACHNEMRIVHQTLCRYADCTCGQSGEHLVRLKLRHEWTCNDCVNLDLVFSAQPLQEPMVTAWQDIGISIARRAVKTKKRARVRFGDEATDNVVTQTAGETLEMLPQGPLCNYLGDVGRLMLSLPHGATSFMWPADLLDRQQRIVPKPQSISLANLLRRYDPEPYQRMAIAYILASAVWQCYTEEWLTSFWTSETVYFMYESDGIDLYASKPYLAVRLHDKEVPEQIEPLKVSHRWTRVLALGLILVELGLGIPYPAQATTSYQKLNAIHMWAKNESQKEQPWPQFHFPDYRLAVKHCLDKDIFKTADTLEKRQEILYKQVVAPLHQLMHTTKWHNDLSNTTLMKIKPRPERQASISEKAAPAAGPNKKAKHWLKRVDALRLTLLVEPRFRIRIAVLDTGYDPDTSFFQAGPREARLMKWQDFVAESNTQPIDGDGHGTGMLSLIMRMAPDADIFVARVAANSADLTNDDGRVARAVQWARSEGVDLISMSFGFEGQSTSLNTAVNDCASNGIILLAAASNSGANQAEMFPACHPSVLSIRSTDHEGSFQASNPHESRSVIAFGTLGVSVPCKGLDSEDCSLSGASVSTALATGMAGMLRHYAVNRPLLSEHVQISLRSYEGMVELFKRLAVPTINSSPTYTYIAPWNLEGRSQVEIDAMFTAAMMQVKSLRV